MIAANTGFLFKNRPFLERIEAAARAGFDAVEFHDEAQAHDLAQVRAALSEAGLPLLGLNVRMGDTAGCAGDPGAQGQARADIDEAIHTARALGGRAVHVLAGKPTETEEAWATYRANLSYAATAAPELTILIEPLSARAVPGYLLSSVAQAASVVEWVAQPNVRIMFDVFHVEQNGDDVSATLAAYAPHVGHVQIADPQTRHEPSAALVRLIRRSGWAGPLGAEYVPLSSVEVGLGWLKEGAA